MELTRRESDCDARTIAQLGAFLDYYPVSRLRTADNRAPFCRQSRYRLPRRVAANAHQSLGVRLEFQAITARMSQLDPEVQVQDLLFFDESPEEADALIRSLSVRVDLVRSLVEQRLVIRSLTISGLELISSSCQVGNGRLRRSC